MTVGEKLKRERTSRKISLDDIAKDTKIAKMFLIAIENDDFEGLPGGIYTRNFLRSYSNYLGLDSDIITAEFHEEYAITPQSVMNRERTKRDNRAYYQTKRRAAVILAVFLLGVAATGYLVYRYSPMFQRTGSTDSLATERSQSEGMKLADAYRGSAEKDAGPEPVQSHPRTGIDAAQAEVAESGAQASDIDEPQETAHPVVDERQPEQPLVEDETASDFASDIASVSLPVRELSNVRLVNGEAETIAQVFGLKAVDDVWVEVFVDGQLVTKRMLRAGESRFYRYGSSNALRAGDLGNLVFQDGVDYLGEVSAIHMFVDLVSFGPGQLEERLRQAIAQGGE